jgi:type VI secretion system protein ImpL
MGWFAAILAVLVAVSLTVIWLVGLFFHAATPLLWLLTALVLLIGFATLLVRYFWQRQQGTKLAGAIVEQGRKQAEAAPAEKRKELLELNNDAAEAITMLRRSHAGDLYALPWYIIVGPPGAGKTTAIKESGLRFPLEKPVRGTGGTLNCYWWFGNEVVLLDTAGRYTTEEKDHDEWLAFLDIPRRYRPRKPIDGLIVALSISDLAEAQSEDIATIARTVRARLDEVTTRLKMLMPVYVVFTKADLIAGFTDFFDDLRPSDREQPWGMTFPVDRSEEPRELFEREFDVLTETLYGRAVRRLHAERRVNVRRALWGFPREVSKLRANLAELVGELFAKNTYQETPLLRGVYFTSGTQNARSSSRVIADMGVAFGIRNAASAPAAPIEPKSYFLNAVFRGVMFPDRALAGRTEAEKRRQRLMRTAAAAFAVLVSGALLLPGCLTWSKNRELVASVSASAGAIRTVDWSTAAGLDKNVTHLDAAREQLTRLADWKDNGAPTELRWGMYVGDGLYASLRAEYGAALGRLVVQPAKKELENRLRALDTGPVRTSEHFGRDFDTLKLYLMLGDAAHMASEWATPRLLRVWTETSGAHSADDETLLMAHVKQVLDLVHRGELRPSNLDSALVARSRSILAQVPQTDRLYEALTGDANASLQPIRREAIIYTSAAKYVQQKKGLRVAGAYTKPGWKMVKKLLGEERDKLAAEQWVLAESDEGGSQAMIDKLRSLYWARYQEAWRDFLADFFVQDPGNAEVAIDELNTLAEPEWPYLRLIRTVGDNVVLDVEDDKGIFDKAIDKAKEVLDGGTAPKHVASPVEIAFRPLLKFALPPESAPADNPPPTPLSQYEALLAKLVGALTDLRDAETGTDPGKVGDVFKEAVRSTSALLSEQDAFTRPLLSPLLMQPITLAWRDVVHDTGAAVGADWESSVWTKWHDKLEGKYPFGSSPSDATLDDMLNFFAPGDGTLWSFYDEALKPTLDRSGTTFSPSRRFRSSVDYSGEFLDVCLKRGRQITDVLFAPKTDHAAVVFDVNLHSVSPSIGEVTFEVDGVSHVYRNEPEEWITITWPGKSPRGARMRVRGTGGMSEDIKRPGDFGLFRLLDAADVKPGRAGGRADGTPTLVATWNLRGSTDAAFVSIDLRPARNENPLAPGFFKDYQCPRTITNR